MLIPDVAESHQSGTRTFDFEGRTWLIAAAGQLSLATTLLQGKTIGFSWAWSPDGGRGLHVRRGGADRFARGEYLGLFGSTEDIPADVRRLAEAAIRAAGAAFA